MDEAGFNTFTSAGYQSGILNSDTVFRDEIKACIRRIWKVRHRERAGEVEF